ncbi:MAG: NINE protein [Bacteroidia bacterium]|nr:NINE protein [Bacteroidia bacterium]
MEKLIVSFLFLMLMSFSFSAKASNSVLFRGDTVLLIQGSDSIAFVSPGISKDSTKQKKLVSALFAFPFPFGFMGAHRVMLGTKPWVPVVYVVTLGGCFGLLPLIDFCVLSFSKDISEFENNPNVFMWIKEKNEKEESE